MSTDEFRSWTWDREDKAANRQALVIERHGHRIVCDHRGLLIDGKRLDTTPPYAPMETPAGQTPPVPLELGDDGLLVYRGQPLVRLTPGGFELLDADAEAAAPAAAQQRGERRPMT